MIILAHRGYPRSKRGGNSTAAFARALQHGFSIETDIRDQAGKLVIAHDLPRARALRLESCFADYKKQKSRATLALNIKADGLLPLLMPLLKRYHIRNYFLFDMSVPEAVRYIGAGLPVFTRQSEYEPHPAFYADAAGVWLDEFSSDWVTESIIRQHLRHRKQLCLVSPELHGRALASRWAFYKRLQEKYPKAILMLCTDHPEKAAKFFHG